MVTSPVEEIKKGNYIQKWLTAEMSNQEFLLVVNKYGGRSFNDLTQYPIFPWVLSKYKCSLEDLRKEMSIGTCFRNLTLHTGILSEEKKAEVERLYQEGPEECEYQSYGQENFHLKFGFSNIILCLG